MSRKKENWKTKRVDWATMNTQRRKRVKISRIMKRDVNEKTSWKVKKRKTNGKRKAKKVKNGNEKRVKRKWVNSWEIIKSWKREGRKIKMKVRGKREEESIFWKIMRKAVGTICKKEARMRRIDWKRKIYENGRRRNKIEDAWENETVPVAKQTTTVLRVRRNERHQIVSLERWCFITVLIAQRTALILLSILRQIEF